MATSLDLTIVQGANFAGVVFYYPRDLSAGVAKGQIRTNYLSKGGQLIASFNFLPLVYGQVVLSAATPPVDRTIIAPILSAATTATIPYSNKKYFYDIFATLGTERLEIARGFVSIVPSVTEV